MPHGKGAATFRNGTRYDGEWRKGLKDDYTGNATEQLADGYKFKGEFNNGLRHGKGELVEANGVTISGTWNMGHLDGIATVKFADSEAALVVKNRGVTLEPG